MELFIDQKQSKRLIVLITDRMMNNRELAYAIHWMASRENLPVLYLVLVDDPDDRVAASRDMATMKAVTAANRLLVESKLTETGYLLQAMGEIAGPGDVIICPEEQMIVNGLFKTIPMSDFLSSHLNSSVRTISGYYHPFQTDPEKRFPEIFALFGFLIILALFTWLQIRIDQALDDTLAKIIVMVTFCLEMAAVWSWNKFTYR